MIGVDVALLLAILHHVTEFGKHSKGNARHLFRETKLYMTLKYIGGKRPSPDQRMFKKLEMKETSYG